MTSRNKMLVGLALAALALNGCGQKPAPAEAANADRAAQSAQSMRITHVAERNVAEQVSATGRLVVRDEAAVGTELPGYRVQSVLVDEGDWVKQGQPLARLDDTLLQAQIAQAEAQLATQKATLAFKNSQLERAEALTKEGAFSQELLEQRRMESAGAEASLLASQAGVNEMKARQARMTLRAPVSGVILQRALRPGDISGGSATPYFRIARDGLIEVDAELADAKLSLIKPGDPATVKLPSGEVIEGKVRFVSPRVDASTSLGRARVELPYNPALRAGGYAEAAFGGLSREGLSVPAGAIRYESGGPSLMLVDAENRVHKTPVKLGDRVGDYVQLIEGPPAGSRVLAMGSAFTLEGDIIEPIDDNAAAAQGGARQQ